MIVISFFIGSVYNWRGKEVEAIVWAMILAVNKIMNNSFSKSSSIITFDSYYCWTEIYDENKEQSLFF